MNTSVRAPFKYALIVVAVGALGYGAGYFYAPDKIKVKEKIVYKTKRVKEENRKETKKYDPVTGNLIEETVETGTKETNTDTIKRDKKKETIKSKKMWALKAGGYTPVTDPGKIRPRVGGEFRLPVFSSWVGVEADIDIKDPTAGVYLRLEF
jgi:hypothetical protein